MKIKVNHPRKLAGKLFLKSSAPQELDDKHAEDWFVKACMEDGSIALHVEQKAPTKVDAKAKLEAEVKAKAEYKAKMDAEAKAKADAEEEADDADEVEDKSAKKSTKKSA